MEHYKLLKAAPNGLYCVGRRGDHTPREQTSVPRTQLEVTPVLLPLPSTVLGSIRYANNTASDVGHVLFPVRVSAGALSYFMWIALLYHSELNVTLLLCLSHDVRPAISCVVRSK